MSHPVIFLDVDGVLHPGTYEAHKAHAAQQKLSFEKRDPLCFFFKRIIGIKNLGTTLNR